MKFHRSHAPRLFFAALSLAVPLSAGTFNEIGDAGETLATANVTTGISPLTQINGTLVNLGNETNTIDDIDVYQISITNPAAFAITVSATLSGDNDAYMILLNSSGDQVLADDDSSGGKLPGFLPGSFTGLPGTYYVAFLIWNTNLRESGNIADGWVRAPIPFQTGPYQLTLSGTDPALVREVPGVPEPSNLALSGLVALIALTLRRKS